MNAANQKQWTDFWQRLGATGDVTSHWQRLQAAYSETWRAYHNLTHIGHCLTEFETVKGQAGDAISLEAALWFHDVVYDTHAKDNEERSADVAQTVLSPGGLSDSFIARVRALILATRHNHQPSAGDEALMVDIDLSILGQSSARYAEFEEQIRAEYSWVSNPDFAAGRSAILNNFLNRESIYTSPVFIQKYEQPARKNLAWALARLAGKAC